MQYAYLSGVRDFVLNKKDYLLTAVGNPGRYFSALLLRTIVLTLVDVKDGDDKPNKKFFDPRVWVREGEKTMTARVKEVSPFLNHFLPLLHLFDIVPKSVSAGSYTMLRLHAYPPAQN